MLFIVGKSGTGKTTFAKLVGNNATVSASGWIRQQVSPEQQDNVEEMTRLSLMHLKQNPDVCYKWIERVVCTNKDKHKNEFVLEGVRNPFDFVKLFDPLTDTVLFLEPTNATDKTTKFEEEGIEVIKRQVEWLVAMGLLETTRVYYENNHLLEETVLLAKTYKLDPKTNIWKKF